MMENSDKNTHSQKNTISIYQYAKKNINTRYLNADVLKYLSIFRSDKLINKHMVQHNFKLMSSDFGPKTFNSSKNIKSKELPSIQVNQTPNKVQYKLNKKAILKTGKMLRNEKMRPAELINNVNDKEDYDYLVKVIINSSNKKKQNSEEESTFIKERLKTIGIDSKHSIDEKTTVSTGRNHLNRVSKFIHTSKEKDSSKSVTRFNEKKRDSDNFTKNSEAKVGGFDKERFVINLKSNKKNYVPTRENISLEYLNNKKFLENEDKTFIYQPIKFYSTGPKLETEIKSAKKLIEGFKKVLNH